MRTPYISVTQMREVDRLMIEEAGIPLEMMMENAGRSLAELALRFEDDNFAVLAGNGNNGGGGLAAARHLINRRKKVHVILAGNVDSLKETPKKQYKILSKMTKNVLFLKKNKTKAQDVIRNSNLILDCLLGYSLKGDPKGNIAKLIKIANESKKNILSLDAPSGLNLDNGRAYDPCIMADSTMTLALPKKGFLNVKARKYFGNLYLADISVPKTVYEKIGIRIGNLFGESPIVRLR